MAELKYDKYVIKDIVKENQWGGQGIGLGGVPDGIVPAGCGRRRHAEFRGRTPAWRRCRFWPVHRTIPAGCR